MPHKVNADEDPAICHQDLELVFAELPKFAKSEADLSSTLDRWLYFLKTAEDLTAVPRSLALEPAIVKALEMANRAAWTEEELEFLETREMWIADQRDQQQRLRKAHEAERNARAEGEAKGKAKGKAEMLLRLLHRRYGTVPDEVAARVKAADADQLDRWSEQFVDASALDDVFR